MMISTASFFELQSYALEQSHALYDVYAVLARRAYLEGYEHPPTVSRYQVDKYYQSITKDHSRLSYEFSRLQPYSSNCVGIDPNFRAAAKPYIQMKGGIGNMYGKEKMGEVLLRPSLSALDALTEFLSAIADVVDDQLGYHWQVLQTQFKQTFKGRQAHWHTDDCHPAIVKLLVFLDGASEANGTTKFLALDDTEKHVKGPEGTWLLLDVNSLKHSVAAPIAYHMRRTVEVTIGPAVKTNPTAKNRGRWNALYAFLPWTLDRDHEDDFIVRFFQQRYDGHFEKQIRNSALIKTLSKSNKTYQHIEEGQA